MRRTVTFLALLVFALTAAISQNTESRTVRVAFWNVENLFDTINAPAVNDNEFTPTGSQKWNTAKYLKKTAQIRKIIEELNPAVMGLCEVENEDCITDILPAGFRYIHYDSRDTRGIDVALIYNPERIRIIASEPIRAYGKLPTRDLLRVDAQIITSETAATTTSENSDVSASEIARNNVGKTAVENVTEIARNSIEKAPTITTIKSAATTTSENAVENVTEIARNSIEKAPTITTIKSAGTTTSENAAENVAEIAPTSDSSKRSGSITGDRITIIVVHLPSRRGNDPKAAAQRQEINRQIDSISRTVEKVIVMGDFNQNPSKDLLPHLYNTCKDAFRQGKGSYAYRDVWQMYDQIYVSNSILTEARIYTKGLIQPSGRFRGYPHKGNPSDHLPVYIDL